MTPSSAVAAFPLTVTPRSSYRSDLVPTDGNNAIVRTLEAPGHLTLDSNADIKGNVYVVGDLHLDSNARIRKDAFSNGDITMDSNSTIQGNAWAVGSISARGNGRINGTTNPNQPTEMAPYEDCDPLGIDSHIATNAGHITSVNNDNALNSPPIDTAYNNSSNGNTNFAAGDYYFSSFEMDSNAEVTLLSGDHVWHVEGNFLLNSNSKIIMSAGATLEIYITGRFVLESNTEIENPGKPADLLIFSSATDNSLGDDDDAEFQMLSNTGIKAVTYAPRAHVVYNSNSDAYGAVRGRWAQMDSNADFFYDETLADEAEFNSPINLGYKIVYWTEQAYESYENLNTATSSTTTSGTTSTTTVIGSTTTSSSSSSSSTGNQTTNSSSSTTALPNTTTAPLVFSASSFAVNDGDKRFSFTLRNDSTFVCTIEGIDLTSWPNGNGKFEKLEIGGDQVSDGNPAKAPASINNGSGASQSWKDDSNSRRRFSSNQSKRLDFLFKNNGKTGSYVLTIRFSGGCEDLSINHTFSGWIWGQFD